MLELVECVPNFSEGRDRGIIDAIASAISSVEGVKLLDVDPGADTNRTVVTFIGNREAVLEAAFQGIARAAELIDMRKHQGAHARMGATDVCPFVPVSGVTVEQCIELCHRLGQRVWDELKIPVYLYEKAATRPERRNLADIRAGEYEGLPEKLKDPNWHPDYGEPVFNERSGATVIGVREFLIAYNINLNTRDRKLASDIALSIREKGRLKRDLEGKVLIDEEGKKLRVKGLLSACKAVGWYIDEYKMAQISMNLVNYKVTPPHVAFEEVRKQAKLRGLRVTGSEIVGLVPKEALLIAGRYYLQKQGKPRGVPERELIRLAIQSLGLNEVAEFDPAKKVIEYQFQEFENPLIDLTLRDFADELSTDSPAPGGGSVSALAGSLSAALTSMVANLTHGKKGYEPYFQEMDQVSIKAQKLKDELLRLIDLDTAAFNKVMDAFRLPKKTEEQRKIQEQAVQEATKKATEIPLKVMRTVLECFPLLRIVAEYGNKNSVSDAGVGVLMARAAIHGAGLNVLINLPSIEDQGYCQRMKSEVEKMRKEADKQAEEILLMVEKTIAEL